MYDKNIFQMEDPLLWKAIIFLLFSYITQKPTKTLKNKLQFIFKLHHQSSLDHDNIIFYYTKHSIHSHAYVNEDESNTLILTF
jgi:hypothetical protein